MVKGKLNSDGFQSILFCFAVQRAGALCIFILQ